MESLKQNMTTRFLWGSGTLCAILAIASLFACTPAHRKAITVERIPANHLEPSKSCPFAKVKLSCAN